MQGSTDTIHVSRLNFLNHPKKGNIQRTQFSLSGGPFISNSDAYDFFLDSRKGILCLRRHLLAAGFYFFCKRRTKLPRSTFRTSNCTMENLTAYTSLRLEFNYYTNYFHITVSHMIALITGLLSSPTEKRRGGNWWKALKESSTNFHSNIKRI